jgi:hypothetical protein
MEMKSGKADIQCHSCNLATHFKGDRVGWKGVQLKPNDALSLVWFCMTKEPCKEAYEKAICEAMHNWGFEI